jgi:hypothetical protein
MKSKHALLKIVAAGVVCLMLTLACSFTSVSAPSPTPPEPTITASNTPVPTNTARPTNTPRPTSTTGPTNTPEPPSCYKWDQITTDMAGQVVCVFGVAYSHQGQSRIDFSPEKNTFFLIDTVYYYPNLGKGSCVAAEEKVEVYDGKIPFMTINGELYICEPWMEEAAK